MVPDQASLVGLAQCFPKDSGTLILRVRFNNSIENL